MINKTLKHAAGLGLAVLMLGATAVSAKTLVYCSEGSPESFTPAMNGTGTSFDANRPVFDKLTAFERGGTNVGPGLATSWDVTDGGKTLTFHLRKGVKFHSGVNGFKPTRDFNATTCCSRSTVNGKTRTLTSKYRAANMITSTIWTCRRSSTPSRRRMTTPL